MQKENLPSIVAKAQEGDNGALNTLFTETYNDVYYFALKTVKDESLAADITQETFITIFKNINNLNDTVAYPAWSRQITYRHCLQHLKKQNRETTVDENEDGSTVFDTIEEERTDFIPDEKLDKEDFKKTILEIVDNLPEEQRTAVILYYYDELSVKQIAEIQGVSEGTVKSRLNYARKTIKSSVETYEKKHNVKLHSVGVLPLLLWFFKKDAMSSSMPMAAAQTVASGISGASGTTVYVSSMVKNGAKAVWSLWQKIAVGLVATAVAIGGTVAVVNIVNKPETSNSQDKGATYAIYEYETSKLQNEEPTFIIQGKWQGKGLINDAQNSSVEDEFALEIGHMDNTYIKGLLVVSDSRRPYWLHFEGVARVDHESYEGSIFYDVKQNEESKQFSKDWMSENTELTLRYDTEEERFYIQSEPFDAVLEKINIIFHKK